MIYVPTLGGANKGNRLLLEGLASRQHLCRALVPSTGSHGPATRAQFRQALAARGIQLTHAQDGNNVFHYHGVQVHAVDDTAQLRAQVERQVRAFDPTWLLVSCEDPGQLLLEAALKATSRVVCLVHTTPALPFGPRSFLPSPAKAALLRQTAGVITVSRYLQDYLQRWGGLESVVIPFPVYGSPPFPQHGRFDSGSITLINPCAYKGITVLVALARALPDVPFAAVPTWGTTDADRAALAQLPNVTLWEPADDIDQIFAQTRVLLMPSLWAEGLPLLPVEAMLRGIPVLASDMEGLTEAMLGMDYVLPVQPITRYEERFDDRGLPVAVMPKQDVTLWLAALRELLSDRTRYEQLSAASRQAALAFVAQVDIAPFEDYLTNLAPASQYRAVTPPGQQAEFPTEDQHRGLDHLSAKKRALLALRLSQKSDEQSAP